MLTITQQRQETHREMSAHYVCISPKRQPTYTEPENTWWICLAEVEITFSERFSCPVSLLQRYKLLWVRLHTAQRKFRSLKGYADMLYNKFSSTFLAITSSFSNLYVSFSLFMTLFMRTLFCLLLLIIIIIIIMIIRCAVCTQWH